MSEQRGHTETGPRFKVSSERPEKRGIDLATPGLVVQRVIHYTTAAPTFVRMLIIIISRSSLKLGHVGSKTRLLGQQATQVSDLGPLWPSCFIVFQIKYDLMFQANPLLGRGFT